MRYLILTILAAVLLIPAWGWAAVTVDTGAQPDEHTYSYTIPSPMPDKGSFRIMQDADYQCYQRMREAFTKMKEQMRPNPNSRSLMRGFTMTEDAWNHSFEPIYQDCVEGR